MALLPVGYTGEGDHRAQKYPMFVGGGLMTSVRLMLLVFLVLAASSACSGGASSPTAPSLADPPVTAVTPTTCTDPKARNVGGPLPCVFPVAPYLKLSEITPLDGSTILFSLGPEPRVTVEYEFDPNIPGTVGIGMYLSVDCTSVIPYTRSPFRGSGTKGKVSLQVGTPHRGLGIPQTKCIVARIERMDGTGREVLEVVHTLMVPWVFDFK